MGISSVLLSLDKHMWQSKFHQERQPHFIRQTEMRAFPFILVKDSAGNYLCRASRFEPVPNLSSCVSGYHQLYEKKPTNLDLLSSHRSILRDVYECLSAVIQVGLSS
jgi:hypothetical protein